MRQLLIVDENIDSALILKEQISLKLSNIDILTSQNYKETTKKILDSNRKIKLAIIDITSLNRHSMQTVDFLIHKKIPTILITEVMNESIKKFILEKDILNFFNKQDIRNIEQLTSTIDRALKNYSVNILVVDDSLMQLNVAAAILEDMKINTLKAQDGVEALDILKNGKSKIHLLLTDYNMPRMDGVDLTIKVRELYKKDRLGIIVLSANDNQEIATKFLKIGANDFINKPYSKIEFQTRVNINLEILDLFEQTRDMANKDFLTGSYNRRYFFEKGRKIFNKAFKSNQNLAIAMLDIDKFKKINDTYGHDIGDIAIKSVPSILELNLDLDLSLISRFGGEEFCILISEISIEESRERFEKILTTFEENIINIDESTKLSFTVSIGICYGLKDSLEDMIKTADSALYHCKNSGRNQISIINNSIQP